MLVGAVEVPWIRTPGDRDTDTISIRGVEARVTTVDTAPCLTRTDEAHMPRPTRGVRGRFRASRRCTNALTREEPGT
jgi:hypothetical protein